MNLSTYLYTLHTEEGIEPFCYQEASASRQKLQQIPRRSAKLQTLRAQHGFFTALNVQPVSATAQWVEYPLSRKS